MTTINTDQLYSTPDPLLCLSDVLTLIGVSESTWWAGVASGKFPPAVKCGRRSFWPQSAIAAFIESLKRGQSGYATEMASYLEQKNPKRLLNCKKEVNTGDVGMMSNIDDHFIVHPHDGESPLEVRAINKFGARTKLFYPKNYSNPKEMQEAFYGYAMYLNQQGYNCYTVMNPIRPEFIASDGKGTTKDGIANRTKVMVDLDRKCNHSRKHPATSDELNRAEDLINKISDYAVEVGWGMPNKVMSGNGYHLYFTLLGLGNDDESELLIKEMLETLAEKFDTDEFEIDTVVFDANRITKIIGTVARKGEETPIRPYRTVELIK